MGDFEFYVSGEEISTSGDISLFFPGWRDENVAFIAPHDDDGVIGSGLLMQAVKAFGGKVHLMIVGDGRQGYCSEEEISTIYDTRRKETERSSEILGIDEIHRFEYPEGDFALYFKTSDGIIRTTTQKLKEVNATRIVVPTINDAHPDHQYVNRAARIAFFHANGGLWDGYSTDIRDLLESAIYCPFDTSPDRAVNTSARIFKKKKKAISAFKSQRQIRDLVEILADDGPQETFRSIPPPNYSSRVMFEQYFQ